MTTTMKAAWVRRYGGPEQLELRDLPRPTPGPGQVLIRVATTTVSTADWRIRSCEVPPGFGPIMRLALGFSGPRQPILGTELAGVIDAIGTGVTNFRVGDAVIAMPGAAMGAHAELILMPANRRVIL